MLLDPSTAAHCSVVAESLRRVGFDGRSDGVIQWWSGLSSLRVRVPAERAKPVAPLSRGHAASL